MNERWTLVKISKATRERLERVRDSMLLADCVGQRNLERDNRDRVSLDQVIGLLILMRERHAERRKRATTKKRKPKTPTPNPGVVPLDGYWQQLLDAAPDPEKTPKTIV